jgi:hypothetical protein
MQKEMKTYLLILLIACQSYVAFGQDWNKTPYETRSLANDGIKAVFVKTSGGSINVSGETGESPRIEIYVHGNNGDDLSREEIKKRLENDYNLDVSTSGGELHVDAKRKHDGGWDWRRQLNISFKIFVPKQVSTHLNTSGGSIHLDNLSGDENFETSGGSLHIDALTGMVKGETSGGSIEVSNSGSEINLGTSGGSIHADNCRGKIHLETSGGSLHLQSLKGTINANTSGGSVTADNIDGELITGTSGGSVNLSQLSCSLEASTSGGSMHVEMIKVGKYVKLDDSGGHVDLRLPANQGYNLNLSADKISPATSMGNFSGQWDKDHVNGSFNGGGIPVHVDVSGHLNIEIN